MRIRQHRLPHPAVARLPLPAQPDIVAAVTTVQPRLVVLAKGQRVPGMQRLERKLVPRRHGIVDLERTIVVAGKDLVVASLQLKRQVGVSAPARHPPRSAPLSELTGVGCAHAGQTQTERRRRRAPGRSDRFHGQHPRQPVPEISGETSGDQIETADRRQVDDGKRPIDVLEVKRLDQVEPVQPRQQLRIRRPAYPKLGGKVIRRDAGQPRNRPVQVLPHLRQRFQVRLRQGRRRGTAVFEDAESTRRDNHLRQAHRRFRRHLSARTREGAHQRHETTQPPPRLATLGLIFHKHFQLE
jgi:hypothetical protein